MAAHALLSWFANKYRETKREQFLSSAELQRLGATLTEVEANGSKSPFVVAALPLNIIHTFYAAGDLCGRRLYWQRNRRFETVRLDGENTAPLRPQNCFSGVANKESRNSHSYNGSH